VGVSSRNVIVKCSRLSDFSNFLLVDFFFNGDIYFFHIVRFSGVIKVITKQVPVPF
jgi:hypothetical protein